MLLGRKKGYKCSEETKKKISENNARYWLGKKRPPFSEEWIRKISESHKGKSAYIPNEATNGLLKNKKKYNG